jgi:hypothetical protein
MVYGRYNELGHGVIMVYRPTNITGGCPYCINQKDKNLGDLRFESTFSMKTIQSSNDFGTEV